ncbi:MAG: hypothetical protein Pars92KO_28360 [Parasphingorhabdus sp.]
MTGDLLSNLEQGFEALVEALDGQDPDQIIAAAAAIRPLVAAVDQTGAWRQSDALKNRVLSLSKLIEAARFRVNKLTNLNQQRAINLSHALGAGIAPTYDRPL